MNQICIFLNKLKNSKLLITGSILNESNQHAHRSIALEELYQKSFEPKLMRRSVCPQIGREVKEYLRWAQ
jgi:hypothetical protein